MSFHKGRRAPESVVDHGERELNVLRDSVDADALNNGVDLMSPPCTLALLVVVHDTVLHLYTFRSWPLEATNSKVDSRLTYLVVKPTAFRIRKHYENIIRHRFKKMTCACDRATGSFQKAWHQIMDREGTTSGLTSASDETSDFSVRLPPDFRTSSVKMCIKVAAILQRGSTPTFIYC